ncbi:MAG: agmatine deiminase family protein [Candidatus Cloacimonetes bacterium]|nr:agmatine deiminase family protein [Candidatus Cloacimonadota bacterium]
MTLRRFAIVLLLWLAASLGAQTIDPHDLPQGFAPGEERLPLGRDFSPTDPPSEPVRPVAEWEPMRGSLVRWHNGLGIPWSLAVELAENDELVTLVSGASQQAGAEAAYASHGVNLANCSFLVAATNSKWTRDYGPFFIMGDSLAVVDFIYNRPRPLDDAIPSAYAAWDSLPYYGMSLVHTGGNWITDGHAAAAGTQLVWTENPGLSHTQIDALVGNYTGSTTYHVLPDPLGEYIEHIDCWGKFLSPDKILIGQVPPNDQRYSDFEALAAYFAGVICAWGEPYEVIRVDTPGDWPYTPYTNSLILNRKVFVPQTGHSLDAAALAVYESAMPGYEVIGVSYANWLNTDALHCRVHELPDKRMIELRHLPLHGTQSAQDSLLVYAVVRAHSGGALVADSLLLHWRVAPDTVWCALPLTPAVGDTLAAWLPALMQEGEVQYWLRAADASGRAAQHPQAGGSDPHTFEVAFTALDAPQQPRIVVSGGVVTLSWQAVPSATAYRVESAATAGAEDWDLEDETAEVSLSLPATAERRYYRVTAVRE